MSEAGYVELPVMAWLSGHGSHTPGDRGLGWTYRGEAAMAAFNRPLTDPLVETAADPSHSGHQRRGDHADAQARLAVNTLRKTLSQPDKLTANRDYPRPAARRRHRGLDARRTGQNRALHRIRSRPATPQRLHRHQSIPGAGRASNAATTRCCW